MPGFRITNVDTITKLNDNKDAKLLSEYSHCDNWNVNRATLNKFLEDKLFVENDKYFIILEGVVLNQKELLDKYGENSWSDTVGYLIEDNQDKWFAQLEGPVSGAVYYKDESKWIVFTGILGEKAVYYWSDVNGRIIIGSQLAYVTDIMREQNIERIADEEALCRFAVYGSYIGNETCIKDIKRLYPGECLEISDSQIHCYQYYRPEIKQDVGDEIKSEEEYIEELDRAFKSAMKRILDKDREYDYRTLVDISGGYDSRLNAYTVKSLALKDDNILMDCYAQSFSHDAEVSERVASELGYTYIFMSLDSAECMYGLDENTRMLNGATCYNSITGGRDLLRILSDYNIGLEVTGLLGDVHDGSMVTNRSDGDIDISLYRESYTLQLGIDYDFPISENDRFENHKNELFWFFNRGMICGMGSFLIRQNYVEPVTAFGDRNFMNVYLSIPWDMRVKGKLLRKWLARRYPAAAELTNDRTGIKLKYEVSPGGGIICRIAKQIRKYHHRLEMLTGKAIGMNDMRYWYTNNEQLRSYIDEHSKVMDNYMRNPKIYSVMKKLYESGNMSDKIIMMSINSIYQEFII